MGIFDFITNEFIEVIEWTDQSSDTIVYRFPVADNEIKMGAQLTVRESQVAIFVNEGQLADVFTPGRYELRTQNMPILTTLKSWKYGFDSPFKAEVYFLNTKQFIDQKWGTVNPIMLRDPEFGMLRLRAFGNYAYRVTDPVKFMKEIFGTSEIFDTESVEGQLKRIIISGLTDLLGEAKIPALDLAASYDEISEQAKLKFQPKFEAYGLQITSFFVENISLPEEVEKMLDKRTSMGIVGNMQQYAQFQAAEAIRDAAQNPGGLAGAGVGLGAGAVFGNMMGQGLFTQNQQAQTNGSPSEMNVCASCGAQVPAGHKFCGSCGKPMSSPKVSCIKCGSQIDQRLKFCPECGASQNIERHCANCGAKVEGDTKFCTECGAKI